MLSRFLLFICLLLLAHSSLACFSSGNPTERERNPEAAKLRAEQNKQPDNNIATSAENGEPELEVEASFLKDYLREFGHLDKEGSSADLSRGIKHFQEFLGFKPTGRMDLPTLARMSWKRCGNPDEAYAAPQICERTSLFWHLDTPTGADFPLPLHEMKELIRQAFTAWEIVIAMEFLEATSPGDAHIHFGILEEKAARAQGMRNGTSKTGLGIATASPAPLSKIWLNKHENWSTFQTQEEGKIDLFLVLIHEIGHSLGLKHSGDDQSVMFPMFERPVGEQLPVISNDDVERLRALYETSESVDATDHDQESAASSSSHGGGGSHHHNVAVNSPPRSPSTAPLAVKESDADKDKACPHSITAAANVNPETLYVFNEGQAWLLRQGKLAGGPLAIEEVFPDGPDTVDVAFTAGRLTILTKGRIVFGYEFDAQQNKFTRAKGFPRELHNRILFTPESAFPIANGSVILIKDKVFATYNVESNTPHMLGNVDEFFPNLPEGLRSGFPASPDFSIYHMLTPEYAFLYDVRITRSVGSQSIGQFLGCDPQSAAGSLQPPPQSSRPQQPQPVPLQPIRPSQPQQQGGPAQIPQQQPNRGSQQPTGTMVHGQGPPGARFWKRR